MTRALLAIAMIVALPAAAQEAAPPPLVAPPVPQVDHWRPNVMLEAGAVFHELYGIPYGTGSLAVRYGGSYRHFGIYGELMGEAGAALPRLPIGHYRAGMLLQYVNRRLRLGAGFRLGEIFVQRATQPTIGYGFSLSVYAMASVDLVRWSRRAMYLGVEVGFDFLAFQPNAQGDQDFDLSPMAKLQLGFRL